MRSTLRAVPATVPDPFFRRWLKGFAVATEATPASSGPLTLNVYNVEGDTVGTVQLDPADLGGKINQQLLHDVVLMYLANQRAGTHSTLRPQLGWPEYQTVSPKGDWQCSRRHAPHQ